MEGRSFLVLGAVGVDDRQGQPRPIPGNKARALLALLLVRANSHVPTDQLEDELWDGTPPPGARSTVQAHVCRLRGLLRTAGTAAVLDGGGGGYRLRVEPDEIDAFRFECLAAQGERARAHDPARAVEVLTRALDEWRGPALQDVRHLPRLYLEAQRLDELRLATIEARMDAELASGGHVMAVAALQRLVDDHPYRERLWSLLLLALYRSGRQVEALRAYQAARGALTEIGVEPGPELRALDAAISREDPELRAPAGAPRRAASAGAPGAAIVLLDGESPSAALDVFARDAATEGTVVLRGGVDCARTRPYQAIDHALAPLLAGRALDPDQRAALAPIVDREPPAPGVDPAFQRFRAFDAVAGLLHAAAAERRIVLALDGIDDAGASTLDLVEHLARQADPARLTIALARSARRSPGVDARLIAFERAHLLRRLGGEGAASTTAGAPDADYAGLAADAFGHAAHLSARAGDDALLRLGFDEAAQHYRAALAALDQQPEPPMLRRVELLVALGRACQAAYQLDAALDAFRRAAAGATDLGAVHLLADAAVGVAMVTEYGMADNAIVALLTHALNAVPDETPVRVELLAGLARALPQRDPAAARTARDAVALARRIDAPRALTLALATAILVGWGPRRVDARLADIDEVIARAAELEWHELVVEARAWRAATLDQLGRRGEAADEIAVVQAWAELSRRPFFLALASMHAVADHLRRGEVAAADAALADLPSGAEVSPNFSAGFAAQLFLLRRQQGRLAEFVPLLAMLAGDDRAPAAWHAAHVLAMAETGEPAAPDALAAAVAGLNRVAEDWLWVPTVALLADACLHLEDHRVAGELRRRLLPHEAETVVVAHGVATLGPVAPRVEALARVEARRPVQRPDRRPAVA